MNTLRNERRVWPLDLANRASGNFLSWWNLIGTKPARGMWRHRRFVTRAKTLVWATMFAFSIFLLMNVQTLGFWVDAGTVCELADGSGFRANRAVYVLDPTNPPAGVTCKPEQVFNVIGYGAGALMFACLFSWANYLRARPYVDGRTRLFRPDDEADRVEVRFQAVLRWPGTFTLKPSDFKGWSQADIDKFLTDHMRSRIDIVVSPFTSDVMDLAGGACAEKCGPHGDYLIARGNFKSWLHGQSQSYVAVRD